MCWKIAVVLLVLEAIRVVYGGKVTRTDGINTLLYIYIYIYVLGIVPQYMYTEE